jgi:hypothetical protein
MYPHIEEQLIKSMENWAKAVKEKTEAGLDIMHILEYAVRTEGVYKVMERFSA